MDLATIISFLAGFVGIYYIVGHYIVAGKPM